MKVMRDDMYMYLIYCTKYRSNIKAGTNATSPRKEGQQFGITCHDVRKQTLRICKQKGFPREPFALHRPPNG